MNDFFDKVKRFADKGLEASKEMFETAGEKVQDLGDKGVSKFEQVQLEGQLKKQFSELGVLTYQLLSKDENAVISYDTLEVNVVLKEIDRLKLEIKQREV